MQERRSDGSSTMPWQLHMGQTESTVLLEELETLDAELWQEEEAEARAEAERARPELTMFTDGSRLENGATE